MSTQVILNLPEETYERATQFAAYARRNVSEIVAAALASALPSLDTLAKLRNIAKLPDREVLALTEVAHGTGRRPPLEGVVRLASKPRNPPDAGRAELASLMRTYEMGLLRQSQALAEAVHRGLLPPMQSCAWSSGFILNPRLIKS